MSRVPGRFADPLRIQATFAVKFDVHVLDSIGLFGSTQANDPPSVSGQFLGFDIGLEKITPIRMDVGHTLRLDTIPLRILTGLWDSSPPPYNRYFLAHYTTGPCNDC
ncbi:Hypothetical predicted protein [Pelobates cultripes]|uniref:Uncharacterized protein n=1 Tax=Pelobates cultripes TaxID=61616 RepID=A0AAD1RAL3_PELCU|nr:Hypothetical predicted protein [Pelobates cultripes]